MASILHPTEAEVCKSTEILSGGSTRIIMRNFLTQRLKSLSFVLLLVFFFAGSQNAFSASVTLAWDAKTDSGLGGYKVYYGTSSRSYSSSINVGNVTSYTLPSLADGNYYFAVTAYYTSGTETSFSNEVSKTLSSSPISVDSTFSGYSSGVIDDGVVNASGGTATTWASADTASDHWITLTFPSSTQINSATLWWAYNASQQKYMTSQRVDVQYWNGAAFQTAATIQPTTFDVASSSVSFSPLSTTQLRFYQPANQGCPSYLGVFWITEVEYALNGGGPSLLPAPTNVSVK